MIFEGTQTHHRLVVGLAGPAANDGLRRCLKVGHTTQFPHLVAGSGVIGASIEAAMIAALIAPALPMAKVPTAMPAGICAIDSRESIPLSAFD